MDEQHADRIDRVARDIAKASIANARIWQEERCIVNRELDRELEEEARKTVIDNRLEEEVDGPPQWKRCAPTAPCGPCLVCKSFRPGDTFEERNREHKRIINKHSNSNSYDLRAQGEFRLLMVAFFLLWRRTFRRWYCNYRFDAHGLYLYNWLVDNDQDYHGELAI